MIVKQVTVKGENREGKLKEVMDILAMENINVEAISMADTVTRLILPNPEQVADIAALQREILSVVWQYVKPGGILMYSTCTLTKAENQDNRDWFLENSPFTLLEEKELLPSAETDGFYMIKCRRNKA